MLTMIILLGCKDEAQPETKDILNEPSTEDTSVVEEDCTISIAQDIIQLLSPKWLRIGGYWYPRGGIPIDIFWQTCKQPKNLFIPDHSVWGSLKTN